MSIWGLNRLGLSQENLLLKQDSPPTFDDFGFVEEDGFTLTNELGGSDYE